MRIETKPDNREREGTLLLERLRGPVLVKGSPERRWDWDGKRGGRQVTTDNSSEVPRGMRGGADSSIIRRAPRISGDDVLRRRTTWSWKGSARPLIGFGFG